MRLPCLDVVCLSGRKLSILQQKTDEDANIVWKLGVCHFKELLSSLEQVTVLDHIPDPLGNLIPGKQ